MTIIIKMVMITVMKLIMILMGMIGMMMVVIVCAHLEDDVPRRKLRPCVQTLSASCGNHPYDYARTINMKCILYNSQIYVKRNASTNIF